MSLAWHIAALMREQKLPRLDTMFIKPGAATKPHTQTPEERWRMFMAVSAGSAREHGR